MNIEQNRKPLIGISCGDLNGIGLEVIIKTFSDLRMLDYCTPVIYCAGATLTFARKIFDAKTFNFNQIKEVREARPDKINVVNAWQDNPRINFGQPSTESGKYAWISLQAMAEDASLGLLDAIVTAPIDKHTIQSEEFNFPGHTEYLTDKFGAENSLMFLVGEHFKIGVVTGHIPLSEVPRKISEQSILTKLQLMNTSLERDFNIRKPKIAVLGLNPHAGEEGLLGPEEVETITPAIETAKEKGIMAFGPFPADGFFGSRLYNSFDGILAMYHDQGLTPFKLLNFETGVNYTAGLKVVRTSPDHGTAYNIAGKNVADESSFREAVFMAATIVKNRALYIEVNENPLRSQLVKEKEM
ncbi:MAG: 4-hydroxythreonine-4-phosphate dehydrogenase PdxA [Sphingobacteriales bacterium]|nr:MAG: 4-hydroxythreonine-4-phosphate dehydrogenase PdxA [Sphingobacteriales bacterium]